MERCARAARNSTNASAALKPELITDSARPQPSCSSGCGDSSRSTDTHRMATAAATISRPSKPDEKYSALWWP
ncbi:hypothetical protein D3C72_1641730 [compost metagenome]